MVKLIAEAGVNHNGDLNTAFKLVEVAAEAGADFIKFQTFNPKSLVSNDVSISSYQSKGAKNVGTQLKLLEGLALENKDFLEIQKCCEKNNIEFMTTAFDSESLKFVVNELRPSVLKVSSGDLNNTPFLHEHSLSKNKIILSTGMSNLGDIEQALSVIAHGLYFGRKDISGADEFDYILNVPEARKLLIENVTLLHCTTSYPAQPSTINLACIKTLRDAFGLNVGFSDHSEGLHIPAAAVAFGATVIEKHFTLDRTMPGPDHAMSIEPNELKELVGFLKDVKEAIGSSTKVILKEEQEHILKARKVLVASENITAGDLFSKNNLQIKRAGRGMEPHMFWKLLGKRSLQDYRAGDLIVG